MAASHRQSSRLGILAAAGLSATTCTIALGAGLPALDAAIASWSRSGAVPTYKYVLVDLNEDSTPDAVVLVTDPYYCGSGGCSMLILRGTKGAFKLLSSSTITREPILVLPEKRYGWHTLSVWCSGGGISLGQVLMRFNGSRYPLNPSMQPKASTLKLRDAHTLKLTQ